MPRDEKGSQSSIGQLGEEIELSNHTLEACDAFICAVYTALKVVGTKMNDVRYWMFCQKGQLNENLPPTSDSLQQHMKQGNYKAFFEESDGGNAEYTVIKLIRMENSG